MKSWVVVAGGLIAMGLAVALHATRPASAPTSSDCEAVHDGGIRQPGNAITALAILGAGGLLARNRRTRLLGIAAMVAGVASALQHATLHPVAAALDGVGVMAILVAAAVLLARQRPGWSRLAPPLAVAVIGVAVWVLSRTAKPLCDPTAALTGHGVWHAFAASAILLVGRAALGKTNRTP